MIWKTKKARPASKFKDTYLADLRTQQRQAIDEKRTMTTRSMASAATQDSAPIASRTRSASRPASSNNNQAKKYVMRDAHAMFFKAKPTKRAKMQEKKAKTAKEKKKKPTTLTNRQRAAEAHAYFIIRHGTTADAIQFLSSNPSARHTTASTQAQLKLMATNPFNHPPAANPQPQPPLKWTTATGKPIKQPRNKHR